jgi:hypothetical protein
MQHLDHDMDDLFRKAGEDYPLRTDEDDWDKISAKLEFTPVELIILKKKPYKDYLFLLFALLLFMILGGLYYFNTPEKKQISASRYISSTVDSLRPGTFKKHDGAIINLILPGNKTSLKKTISLNGEKNLIHKKSFNIPKQESAKTIDISTKNNKHRIYKENNFKTDNTLSFSTLPETSDQNVSAQEYVLKNTVIKNMPLFLQYAIAEPAFHLSPLKISPINKHIKQGVYFGLTGAPEWSKVGSQASTKSGFRGGIILGYRLHSKFSIESGVTLGKNNYYSKGSYFNMSKVAPSMPTGMEILTIDGQTTNVEIPVIVKYYFLQRQHAELFFTGGALSNIYLREKNHYQTMLNGVKNNEMVLYPGNHFSLASQLRISIGYEYMVGRLNSFRIEPYKNIPLKKTGMGSMPVYSSGVNVGLVHFFKR